MRKGLLFWSAIFISILFAGLVLYYIGHIPDERDLSRAIPQPSGNIPFVFISASGGNFDLTGSRRFINDLSQRGGPAFKKLLSIAPLASRSERTDLLITLEGGVPNVFASVKLPFRELEKITSGTVPDNWDYISNVVMMEQESDYLELTPSIFREPLLMKRDGGLLLVSTNVESLKRMELTVKQENLSINTDFGRLGRKYEDLLWFEDGGLTSQILFLYGIPSRSGSVSFYAGWEQNNNDGILEWDISGLETILSESTRKALKPLKWDQRVIFPEPVLFAAGVNFPDMKGLISEDSLSQFESDLPLEKIKDIVDGPVVFTVSGSSKLLLFSLPGLGIQFPERGEAGRDLIRSFWTKRWSTFTPALKPVKGYDTGGAISVPMTLSGVANEEIAFIGFLGSRSLNNVKELGTFKEPDLSERALLWFIIDGPRLSNALEKVSQAGSLAEHFGTDLGKRSEDLENLAARLKNMSRISFTMNDIGHGYIRWSK